MNRFSLSGTRTFVTGANTGMGQAIAVDLAQAGAHVIAVGRSSMEETLVKAAAVGGTADAVQADLGSVAGAVTYLASPAARYVTGITLPVDGGGLGR